MNLVKFKDVVLTPEDFVNVNMATTCDPTQHNGIDLTDCTPVDESRKQWRRTVDYPAKPLDIDVIEVQWIHTKKPYTYIFKSFSAPEDGIQYATGKAHEVEGIDLPVFVQVLSNPSFPDWVGRIFNIPANTQLGDVVRLNDGKNPIDVWVKLDETQGNLDAVGFESFGNEACTIPYSRGTVAVLDTRIINVDENPEHPEWVGRQFIAYASKYRSQLIDLNTFKPIDVWVEVEVEDEVISKEQIEGVEEYYDEEGNWVGPVSTDTDEWRPILWREEYVVEFAEGVPYAFTWIDGTTFAQCGRSVEEVCAYFNETYRGKWAEAINWNWVVPMSTPFDEYMEASQNPDICVHSIDDVIDMNDWQTPLVGFQFWVDEEETMKNINKEIARASYLNNFRPDDDITLDELMVFRTWLARTLLDNEYYIDERDDRSVLITMLEYYASNMYNETIKSLADMSKFMDEAPIVIGSSTFNTLIKTNAGCACNGGTPAIQTLATGVACDPIQMYRNAMYNYMVKTFSDIHYWMDQVEICQEMKKYIDGIIKAGLPLRSMIVDPFADCSCSTINGEEDRRYRTILQNLSNALSMIIEENTSGNLNTIYTAFNQWASYLYEYMYWK